MGRTPGIGDRCPGRDARGGEPVDHAREHGLFPAMQMSRAGDVDHEPVGRIGRDDRRVTL